VSIELHCMDATEFVGTAGLVLTNPYAPLPKGLLGKPCLISNFHSRKSRCEEWAKCELRPISRWGSKLQNTVWVGNDSVIEMDLTDLVEVEDTPGHGWFPLELPKALLAAYAKPGITVIDPFMGRGTVGRACKMLGLSFIGIDHNPDRVALAREYIG
jgi:hypothetical protein